MAQSKTINDSIEALVNGLAAELKQTTKLELGFSVMKHGDAVKEWNETRWLIELQRALHRALLICSDAIASHVDADERRYASELAEEKHAREAALRAFPGEKE